MRSRPRLPVPPSPVARVQAVLGAVAFEMITLQERLEALDRILPVPVHQEAMLDGRIPPDLATELSGRIELISEVLLRDVIEALEGAASLTAHDLAWDFRARQNLRRTSDGHPPQGESLRP
jgi:hypothetical protein